MCLCSSTALSNSTASLIILPDLFALKIYSCISNSGSDIRGSDIGRKDF